MQMWKSHRQMHSLEFNSNRKMTMRQTCTLHNRKSAICGYWVHFCSISSHMLSICRWKVETSKRIALYLRKRSDFTIFHISNLCATSVCTTRTSDTINSAQPPTITSTRWTKSTFSGGSLLMCGGNFAEHHCIGWHVVQVHARSMAELIKSSSRDGGPARNRCLHPIIHPSSRHGFLSDPNGLARGSPWIRDPFKNPNGPGETRRAPYQWNFNDSAAELLSVSDSAKLLPFFVFNAYYVKLKLSIL